MQRDDQITTLAEALYRGTAVDWSDAAAAANTEADRETIFRLRDIADIAAAHADLRDDCQRADGTWNGLRLLEPLGQGSYGTVYRAWDPTLQREVALKLVATSGASEADTQLREGRLLARVRHPNVATVFGAALRENEVGIWMERLHGRTVAQIVAADGPFGCEELYELATHVFAALQAVHEAGVIHRDVKAQNVMREASGRIVLTDFGASQPLSLEPRAPLAGTPLYLAPEVLAGGAATPAADVFSAGVLLHFAAMGAYPLRDAGPATIRSRVLDRRPDVPQTLATLIARCLSSQSSCRPAPPDACALLAAARRPRRPVTGIMSLVLIALVTAGALVSHRATVAAGDRQREGAGSLARGLELVEAGDWKSAVLPLRDAIERDPRLASAQIYLAHSLANNGDNEEARRYAERALTLAPGARDVDRYFIEGSYYHRFAPELSRAAAAYRAALQLQPDHLWARRNLKLIYNMTADSESMMYLALDTAKALPKDFEAQVEAAQWLAMAGDLDGAARHIAAARPMTPATLTSTAASWLHFWPALRHWIREDTSSAVAIIQQLAMEVNALPAGQRDTLRLFIADWLTALGKIDLARDTARALPPGSANVVLAEISLLRGDHVAARYYLDQHLALAPELRHIVPTGLFIRFGRLQEVRDQITQGERRGGFQPYRAFMKGTLALEEGSLEDARALLESARDARGQTTITARPSLAEVHWLQGRRREAILLLEAAYADRVKDSIIAPGGIGIWRRTAVRLASFYDEEHRPAEASAIRTRLTTLFGRSAPAMIKAIAADQRELASRRRAASTAK